LRKEIAKGKSLADFAVDGREGQGKTKKKQSISIKYRDDHGNTWTGRGWKPLWLKAAIESGKTLDDFAV
jgi:DNA-binding protein H-NS